MKSPYDEAEFFDSLEVESWENDELEAGETAAEDSIFGETEETELSAKLLKITNEDELDSFLGNLITRAAGGPSRPMPLSQLCGILRRTAKSALPMIGGVDDNLMAPEIGGSESARVAAKAGNLLGLELEGFDSEDEELEIARRFVRFAGASAKNARSFLDSAPPAVAARRAVGAAVLQELYESPRLLNEGLLSFEYPIYVADDQELDYFLGKMIRRAGRAVSRAAKAVGRNPLIRGVGKTVGGVAKTVGKGLSAIDKVVPVSMLTSGLGWTPLGMAVRAGLGAVQAAGEGRNVFQGAMRTMAANPGTRFLVDSGMAAARGENIVKAAQKAFQAGIGDVRKSLQFAAMVAPFVPGIGTGVAAALGAANALASGQPITEALIAAARSAVPGGAIAQTAFDTAVNLAKGKNVGEALLNAARSRLPGGPAAQAAFDAAVTLAKGKSLQDAAFAATGRLLPKSPYAADALSFVKKVTSGQNIQRAALSSVGNLVLNRIERQTGPMFAKARTQLLQGPSRLAARATQTAQAAAAAALARARRLPLGKEIGSLDEFEAGTPDYGEVESFEAGAEDSVFGETEEMELAAQLLEITDENELDEFIGALVGRASGGARQLAGSPPLRGLLRQAAKSALPMIGGAVGNLIAPGLGGTAGSRLASAAGDLFGLELEGLSPEDQEFEVARRFVRFAGAGARNARRFRPSTPPQIAARRALGAAARRHAPGFLRRRKPRLPRLPGGVRVAPASTDWPDYEPAPPVPIAVTCHCGGAPPSAPTPGDAATGDGTDPLPDNEPANSTEPQPQTSKEINMHDLDRTTMEINDEAADFEFTETQDEYGGENAESTFSEEEEAEFAAQLLEINDEAELDQFIGDLLRKARRVVGGALKSPLLRPLGGFIKGAIKKALPIAGSALGNMVVPGLGGQIGSRLASGAGGLLGLELEGLAPEDQEFEVAKQVVRTIGTAVQNAAQSPTAATDPQAAAKAAMVAAARTHLPGLLQGQQQRNGAGHRPRSGRWYRRGGKIVLVGV